MSLPVPPRASPAATAAPVPLDERVHQIPLGRMERPEDVANVIGFLVSPRSEYITGQALSVDGGLVMHG